MDRFRQFAAKESHNHTRTVWVLKCDIRKFFASIDHEILFDILQKHIADQDILWLLRQVIDSFPASDIKAPPCCCKGLPLGNLTSQLLVNIYMNEFDQYVKQRLKVKYFVRYADDFVFISADRAYLENILSQITEFLHHELRLNLHPDKVSIKTFASGIDFLGWVHFPDHRALRTATKKRMIGSIAETKNKKEIVESYLGLLSHGNTHRLRRVIQLGRVEKP
jgi:RNA-directed DNA polymerase